MFETYLIKFQNLNVNKTGNKQAPHKPILLLSIMDMIETGEIVSPIIEISDTLQRRFKQNWKRYVPLTSTYNCKMEYPFYHLSSSSFWHLKKTEEYENKAPTSMKALKKSYKGAEIDQLLFEAMKDKEMSQQLRNALINTYLSHNKSKSSTSMLNVMALIGLVDAWVLNA